MWRLALMMLCAGHAWACSCGGEWPSPKQMWQRAPFVFLGTVDSAEPEGTVEGVGAQSVRLRVDEAFRGASKGQIFELSHGGSSCDPIFRTGERAVYYLFGTSEVGSVHAPACSRSIVGLGSAGDDLLFLRGLPRSVEGTRLSGTVLLYENSPTLGVRMKSAKEELRVWIEGPKGLALETVTNRDGAFEVYGLPSGRYLVRIQVPPGLRVHDSSAPVELAEEANGRVDFVLEPDTRISGRVVDAKGAPVKGVCLELTPEEGEGGKSGWASDCTEEDGEYKMERLTPGRYKLLVESDIRIGEVVSRSTFYYPGVRRKDQAELVALTGGKYSRLSDLRLPEGEDRVWVEGRLVFADGVPASGGFVTFRSERHGYSESVTANADGHFVLPVIRGMEGELSGIKPISRDAVKGCPEITGDGGASFLILKAQGPRVVAEGDRQNLRVELPVRSCTKVVLPGK